MYTWGGEKGDGYIPSPAAPRPLGWRGAGFTPPPRGERGEGGIGKERGCLLIHTLALIFLAGLHKVRGM
jgi:hypothetical protein